MTIEEIATLAYLPLLIIGFGFIIWGKTWQRFAVLALVILASNIRHGDEYEWPMAFAGGVVFCGCMWIAVREYRDGKQASATAGYPETPTKET